MKKTIEVVGAAIVDGNRVLAAQRKKSSQPHNSLKWEFPGGKVEADESHEKAIVREIREELGIEIIPIRELTRIRHEYAKFTLDMTVLLCTIVDGEEPKCLEHNKIAWVAERELHSIDWAEADRKILPDLVTILR
ncbi:MAG: (deoxy)nucleoside triphosphate pyrophosphohydrolase [Bacteroides sp.]|nr:(deoxy)nucleoside triphosphate pyrophosphohydrolase [Bacteroides sp.]